MTQSVIDLFQQIATNEFGYFARLSSVAEVMATDVVTADCEDTLGDVIGTRDPRTIGSVAVIDSSEGDVIGVLNHSTIMRCCPRYFNTLGEHDDHTGALNMSACHLVTRPPMCVSPDATPMSALETILETHCDGMLVYDSPLEIQGILRPVDFVRTMRLYYQVYRHAPPLQRLRLIDLDCRLSLDEVFRRGAQTARDVMSSPITMNAQQPVATAMNLMQQHSVRNIVLLDEAGVFAGVLHINDILMALTPPTSPAAIVHGDVADPLQKIAAEDRATILNESAVSLATTNLKMVEPTSRIPETLDILLDDNHQEQIIVQDGDEIVGIITVTDFLRVFRVLVQLQMQWGRESN